MRGLEGGHTTEAQDEVPPPILEGPAGQPAIGIVSSGFGSEAIHEALRETGRYRVGLVHGVALPAFQPCDVLIFPQRRNPKALSKRSCWVIWEWVEQGGRLILTHDAVGYRDHPLLFPWVCSGGTAHVNRQTVRVVWAPEGEQPLGEITHTYTDHILLRPCLRAKVTAIAVDAETGEPVVSGAEFETGKVVACGLAIGLAPDESESLPENGERGLLEVMLKWLLG